MIGQSLKAKQTGKETNKFTGSQLVLGRKEGGSPQLNSTMSSISPCSLAYFWDFRVSYLYSVGRLKAKSRRHPSVSFPLSFPVGFIFPLFVK